MSGPRKPTNGYDSLLANRNAMSMVMNLRPKHFNCHNQPYHLTVIDLLSANVYFHKHGDTVELPYYARHAKTSRSPLATRPIFLASGLLSISQPPGSLFFFSLRATISQQPGSFFSGYLRPQGRSWPPAFSSLLVASPYSRLLTSRSTLFPLDCLFFSLYIRFFSVLGVFNEALCCGDPQSIYYLSPHP